MNGTPISHPVNELDLFVLLGGTENGMLARIAPWRSNIFNATTAGPSVGRRDWMAVRSSRHNREVEGPDVTEPL